MRVTDRLTAAVRAVIFKSTAADGFQRIPDRDAYFGLLIIILPKRTGEIFGRGLARLDLIVPNTSLSFHPRKPCFANLGDLQRRCLSCGVRLAGIADSDIAGIVIRYTAGKTFSVWLAVDGVIGLGQLAAGHQV